MNMLNQLIIKTLPIIPKPIIHQVAKKYIAGNSLADAVRVTKELEKTGGMSTIDALGEFVTTKDRALQEMSTSSKVLEAIQQNNLKSYLSLKPTSLGLGIDPDFAFNNIKQIVEKARSYNRFVRLDMENSPYTTKTLDLYKKRRDILVDGLNQLGWKIKKPQASLFVWAPVPPGYTSAEFAKVLLQDAGVLVIPGNGYGQYGEGYVRMSLTVADDKEGERLAEAVERIKNNVKIRWS
jgi:alanine-alpha-ketoisovalerate/valine-pyruvate aminotransferase